MRVKPRGASLSLGWLRWSVWLIYLGWVMKFKYSSGGKAVLNKEPKGQVSSKHCLQRGLHAKQEFSQLKGQVLFSCSDWPFQ